jgi:NAD(P)-dependent dehydrogenase (short-subunit alcohol dehydrogenase family)
VTVVECDLDDAESVAGLRDAVQAIGPWRAVVSASGGYAGGKAHETDDPAIESMLGANLLGPWRLARTAAQSMIAAGSGGRIVLVASKAALDVARGQAAYQVSKAALLRLAQVMAVELQGHGITVNAVLPGTMDTVANQASMPKADRALWVTTGSVAALVEWLLSDDAGIVTGAAIPAG